MSQFKDMLAASRKRRGIPEPEPIVEIPPMHAHHCPACGKSYMAQAQYIAHWSKAHA